MKFPKQIKDIVYHLLQEPTLESMREFLQKQTGEHNTIDFKKLWIEKDSLAKTMLAMGNIGGGIILFGVSEKDNGTVDFEGLEQIRDKADVSNELKNYIPSELKYDIYDFSYDSSDYAALEGRKYQMLVVEDTPESIPFMAKKESTHLKTNEIYVRRGTSCMAANREEIKSILSRRINYMHPLTGEPLSLDEHLDQLQSLYKRISKENVYYKNDITEGISTVLKAMIEPLTKGEKIVESNPLYPDEEYEEFISRMINEKKNKIKRVLDLY